MNNIKYIYDMTKASINSKYNDNIPSIDEIYQESDSMIKIFGKNLSKDDIKNLKDMLKNNICHTIDYTGYDSIDWSDDEHIYGWYYSRKHDINSFYWNRFKEYLNDKFDKTTISILDNVTDKIMDKLGDPLSNKCFQRRGLLLGDVQSGKTNTYISICNKAVDVGYKVIIILAGTIENLRQQTQGRFDKEFVGFDTDNYLSNNPNVFKKNIIGVGRIIHKGIKDKQKISITPFTSKNQDFSSNALKCNHLDLKDLNGVALFIVKKNYRLLNNLEKWLKKCSIDEELLSFPMLMIDDEADNASINTNSEKDNPTIINSTINKLLKLFKKATYLGITATPFANIFINPDIEEDGSGKDLFPRHFITLLPTPSNYIGADKMFPPLTSYDDINNIKDVEYTSSIVTIYNEEQNDYFKFGHKKNFYLDKNDLPESLKESIRYFILVSAVSDSRKDIDKHRSMLVNVTRFTDDQNKITELIFDYVSQLQYDIKAYSHIEDSLSIENIKNLYDTFHKYLLDKKSNCSWKKILQTYLEDAIVRIEVRSVNQKNKAKSLDYKAYKDGMRVIAIGGNSLSRGITLEGLCVSYFYRNTLAYDTLIQMGRWFGYRPRYEDLFKVWMGEDIIGHFSEVNLAVNELKEDLREMSRQGGSPKDFGLKIRQHPGSLFITAYNKMKTGENVSRPITVSERMIETPRLYSNSEILEENNKLCENFINDINSKQKYIYDEYVHSYIWKGINKDYIIKLIKNYKSHLWNLNFQSEAICKLIDNDISLNSWDVAIQKILKGDKKYYIYFKNGEKIDFYPEKRKLFLDSRFINMIRVNDRHVRIASVGVTKIGLDKKTIEEIIKINKKYTDKSFLIKNRKPLLLLHIIENTNNDLNNIPKYIYALGLGFPKGDKEKIATYKLNIVALRESKIEDDDID